MAFNNTDFTNSEKILKALDEFLDEQTPPTLERLEDIFPCPIRTLASKQFDGPLKKFVWDVDLTLDKKSVSRLTFYTDSCGIERKTLLDRYAHFGPRYNKRCWDTREELNASINIHTPLVWVNIDMDFKTVETMERVIITWTTVTSEVSAKTTYYKRPGKP